MHPEFRIMCLFDVIVFGFIDSWFFPDLGKTCEKLKLYGEAWSRNKDKFIVEFKEDESNGSWFIKTQSRGVWEDTEGD